MASSSALVFGSIAILAKLGFRAGATPLGLLSIRFSIAFILLLALTAIRGIPILLGAKTIGLLIFVGGCGYGLETVLMLTALERSSAATITLIFYSYPMWTTLLAFLVGRESPKPKLVLALLLGTAGVAIVFPFDSSDLVGPLFALGAAVVLAIYLMSAEIILTRVSALPAASWTIFGAALASLLPRFAGADLTVGGALSTAIALGLMTVLALALLLGAISRIGSSRSSIASMLEPITTTILAALVLDEIITGRIVVGGLFVLTALGLLTSTAERPDSLVAPEIS